MENWIEATAEPRRLFLAWQAPDHLNDRFRWAVAILDPRGEDCALRYLRGTREFESFNQGRTFEQLTALGFQGHPAFNMRREVHSDGVLLTLMRRLPPRSRSDFHEYKRQFRLSDSLELSDFALLGQTEAKLPSDGFSVVDPLDPETGYCDLLLEIAGHRYYVREQPIGVDVGHPIELLPEPESAYDPNAVKVTIGQRKIGNINRLQAPAFLRWLAERRVTGAIERLNGKSDRPRAFIFVRVRPVEQRVAA